MSLLCPHVPAVSASLFPTRRIQVWNGFIRKGEPNGLARYLKAVALLQDRCDKSITKQRATDVLTLYTDAARVKPVFDRVMSDLVAQCKASRGISPPHPTHICFPRC